MMRVFIDLALAFALFMAGRMALVLGGRTIRALRRLHDRLRNRQSYRLGREVQGVRVHEHGYGRDRGATS